MTKPLESKILDDLIELRDMRRQELKSIEAFIDTLSAGALAAAPRKARKPSVTGDELTAIATEIWERDGPLGREQLRRECAAVVLAQDYSKSGFEICFKRVWPQFEALTNKTAIGQGGGQAAPQ